MRALKILMYGNTNNYPYFLAEGFRSLGHEVQLLVTKPDLLHRPESVDDGFKKGYPAWIVDIATFDDLDLVLGLTDVKCQLSERSKWADLTILNDIGPSMSDFVHGPYVAFMTGSDLTYYADLHMPLQRTRHWSADYATSDEAQRILAGLWALVRRQRRGIANSSHVIYPRKGLSPDGDQILEELGVEPGRRTMLYYMSDCAAERRPKSKTNKGELKVVSGARVTFNPRPSTRLHTDVAHLPAVQTHPDGDTLYTMDQKGADILIRGFAKFCSEDGSGRLWLPLKGGSIEAAKALIQDLKIDDRVTWYEEKKVGEFENLLMSADLVCDQVGKSFPGMVMLHAFRLGKPVMANFRLDASEFWYPGLHVETVDHISSALHFASRRPRHLRRLGWASRRFFLNHCTSEKAAEKVLVRTGFVKIPRAKMLIRRYVPWELRDLLYRLYHLARYDTPSFMRRVFVKIINRLLHLKNKIYLIKNVIHNQLYKFVNLSLHFRSIVHNKFVKIINTLLHLKNKIHLIKNVIHNQLHKFVNLVLHFRSVVDNKRVKIINTLLHSKNKIHLIKNVIHNQLHKCVNLVLHFRNIVDNEVRTNARNIVFHSKSSLKNSASIGDLPSRGLIKSLLVGLVVGYLKRRWTRLDVDRPLYGDRRNPQSFGDRARIIKLKILAALPDYYFAKKFKKMNVDQPKDPRAFTGSGVRKVLLVIGTLGPGGAERQLALTAKGLQSLGRIEVTVCFHSQNQVANKFFLAQIKEVGVSVVDLAEEHSWANSAVQESGYDADIRRYRELITHIMPDVVHCWLDAVNVTAGIAAVLEGVPKVVLGGRSVAPINFPLHAPYMRAGYRWLLSVPSVALVNNSHHGARDYEDWLGMEAGSINVIHNAVEALVSSEEEEKAIHETSTSPAEEGGKVHKVVGVFRFSEEKRPLLWLEVAAEIRKLCNSVCFVIVGDGPMRADVRAAVLSLSLDGAIELKGHISDPFSVLGDASLLMLTSRSEGLPNVLMEAQLHGLPVLSLDAGGARETMIVNRTGKIIDSNEPRAIAKEVLDVLLDTDWLTVARQHCRRHVEESFAISNMLDQTLSLYESQIG